MRLSTNLDLRAYAAARDVTMADVAKKLGMAPSTFSVQYMRTEQKPETKKVLRLLIDEVAREKKGE